MAGVTYRVNVRQTKRLIGRYNTVKEALAVANEIEWREGEACEVTGEQV